MEASTSRTYHFSGYGGRVFDSRSLSRNQLGFGRRNGNGFLDNNHLEYYNGIFPSIRCDGQKKDVTVKSRMKKKLKLLKGLSTNLSLFLQKDESLDQRARTLEELSQDLMAQLEQLEIKKKEAKRKRKEEKMKLKALKMKSKKKMTESSSSTSDSSDSECDVVVNMGHLRNSAVAESTMLDAPPDTAQSKLLVTNPCTRSDELQEVQIQEDELLGSPSISSEEVKKLEVTERQQCLTNCEKNSAVVESFAERIDVCLGGKCKKFGAVALLEELEKKIGVEGTVVGCKCMGRCKNGPNVRVSSRSTKLLAEGMDNSVRAPSNPLYVGVGMEDVDMIASNFLAENMRNVGWMAAA